MAEFQLLNISRRWGSFADVHNIDLAPAESSILLGFHAEKAGVGGEGHHEITAPDHSLELPGDATTVTVRISNELIAVQAPKDSRVEISDPVSLSVPAGICHLFEETGGQRIGD